MIDLNITGPMGEARSQHNETPQRSTAMSNFRHEKLSQIIIRDAESHIQRLCTTVGNEGLDCGDREDYRRYQTTQNPDARKHNTSYSKSEWAQNYIQNINNYVQEVN